MSRIAQMIVATALGTLACAAVEAPIYFCKYNEELKPLLRSDRSWLRGKTPQDLTVVYFGSIRGPC